MRAVRFDGPRCLRIDEIARPAVAGPGDAVIRVSTAAIGPLDLERYGGPDPWGSVTPGGACAGVVEEIGRDVRRWRLGDVVLVPSAVQPTGPAGPDQPGQKAAQPVLGRDIAGSHAGWIHVPAADLNLVSVPDPLNLEAQAVVAAGTYASGDLAAGLLAPLSPATIAVVGCDPSALAFISAWFSRKPAGGRVVAADSSPGRVLFARRLGAVGVVDRGAGSARDAIFRAGECDRFDAVVVGTRIEGAALDLAVDLANQKGPIVSLDPPGAGWSTPDQAQVTEGPRGRRIISAGYPSISRLDAMITAIRKGALDLLPLVSHTFPLAEAASAFESAFKRERGVLKVLLKP
ncbi:MAG: alcohol dehydrogenase catalytic domain-containing protein [Chloroflexi bacterium]|nr:alcohol dehydrogenase catalytic domain-containing protein [Chloroflexota bacterium]